MSIAETLVPEFDREMDGTREILQAVPEDKFGWKPHEKSMTLGRLASHVAEMGEWARNTMSTTEYEPPPITVRGFQRPGRSC